MPSSTNAPMAADAKVDENYYPENGSNNEDTDIEVSDEHLGLARETKNSKEINNEATPAVFPAHEAKKVLKLTTDN